MSTEFERQVLQMLKQINKKLKTYEELSCTRPEFVWSIEHIPDTVLIKFNYDREFANFIRSLNVLHWDEYNKGWYAHKDFSYSIHSSISSAFPEWRCIDKR
jgi:hypothetical protein